MNNEIINQLGAKKGMIKEKFGILLYMINKIDKEITDIKTEKTSEKLSIIQEDYAFKDVIDKQHSLQNELSQLKNLKELNEVKLEDLQQQKANLEEELKKERFHYGNGLELKKKIKELLKSVKAEIETIMKDKVIIKETEKRSKDDLKELEKYDENYVQYIKNEKKLKKFMARKENIENRDLELSKLENVMEYNINKSTIENFKNEFQENKFKISELTQELIELNKNKHKLSDDEKERKDEITLELENIIKATSEIKQIIKKMKKKPFIIKSEEQITEKKDNDDFLNKQEEQEIDQEINRINERIDELSTLESKYANEEIQFQKKHLVKLQAEKNRIAINEQQEVTPKEIIKESKENESISLFKNFILNNKNIIKNNIKIVLCKEESKLKKYAKNLLNNIKNNISLGVSKIEDKISEYKNNPSKHIYKNIVTLVEASKNNPEMMNMINEVIEKLKENLIEDKNNQELINMASKPVDELDDNNFQKYEIIIDEEINKKGK